MVTTTIDTQIFYTLNGANGSSLILQLDTDSVTHAVADLRTLDDATALGQPVGVGGFPAVGDIAVDTASGLYFFRGPQAIYEGRLDQLDAIQSFQDGFYFTFAIDPSRGQLFISNGLLFEESYAPTLSNHSQYFYLAVFALQLAPDPNTQDLFAIIGGSGEFFQAQSLPDTGEGAPLSITGLLDVAVASSVVFSLFAVVPESVAVLTQRHDASHDGGVLLYQITDNPNATYTVLYSQATPGAGPQGTLSQVSIDAQHGLYYVTDNNDPDPSKNGIWVGSLLTPGTPQLVLATGPAVIGGIDVNAAPQLLLNQGTVTAGLGNSTPVLLLDGATLLIRDDDTARSGPDLHALLAKATIYITNARAGDELFVNGLQSGTLDNGRITIAWDETNHILTLSGVDSIAAYTQALNAVGYADLGTDASPPQRSIAFVVNDGQLDSPTGQVTVALNQPPTAVNDSATADTIHQITGNVLANDGDPELDPLVVSAVAGGAPGTLFHGTYGDVQVNGDGTYTYQAGATVGERLALAAVANGMHPFESITYTASDGFGTADATLSITIDRTPTLTTPASVNYHEGGVPALIAPAATLGGVDAASLAGGLISIAGSNLTVGDQLTILSDGNGPGQISVAASVVSYAGVAIGTIDAIANGQNGAALTIALNANATPEAAQTLLAHLQFSSTAPTATARDVTLQFGDGLGHFATSAETIAVTVPNQPPTFTGGPDQTSDEDAGPQSIVAWASSIAPGLASESGQALDFQVSTDNPTLFAAAPQIDASGTVTYTAAANANGVAHVTVNLHDDGGTADGGHDTSPAQTFTITVLPVDDAPVNTVPGAQSTGFEADLAIAGLAVGDVDAAGGMITTTLSVTDGTLSVSAAAGATVAGDGTGSLVLTGMLGQIDATLAASIVYHPHAGFSGIDTLTFTTSDDGHTGAGGPLTDTDTVKITVAGAVVQAAPPQPIIGTPGDDSFTASTGSQEYIGLAGVDTIRFDFKLVDATVSYDGNLVTIDGPSGSHTVLQGFETFVFTDGTVNNNDGDPLVDDLYYYSRNHDVWNAHADADAHYHAYGWHEGRDPDAFFSTAIYLSEHPDVRAAGLDPLVSFDQGGWKSSTAPSLTFDPAHYLATNPDVRAAGVDPLAHFLEHGAQEGRIPFAPTEIIASNGFDYVYYLQHNPDVAAAGVDPLQHYETIGWKEGRNPNAYFDDPGYLQHYADVAAAGLNPLDHYDQIGWKEGRDPSVAFDTTSYLSAYPDVAAAGIDPLKHFLQHGHAEGRSTFADGVWG